MGGIPSLRGTDHIGFTVPNLEEAVDFFVDVIGCEYLYGLGPVQSDDNWMRDQLNVHARASFRNCLLRCQFGSNFEIFEYKAPVQNERLPKNSDIGGHHLAFYVDDFDSALAYIREQGLTVFGEPVVRTEGPVAGQTWIYFLSPWDSQLELVSFPNGKGYEKDTPKRQWRAAHPEE